MRHCSSSVAIWQRSSRLNDGLGWPAAWSWHWLRPFLIQMPKHFVNPSFEMVEAPVHLTNGNHLQGVQLHATCKMIVALLISCLALQTYPHEPRHIRRHIPHECVPFFIISSHGSLVVNICFRFDRENICCLTKLSVPDPETVWTTHPRQCLLIAACITRMQQIQCCFLAWVFSDLWAIPKLVPDPFRRETVCMSACCAASGTCLCGPELTGIGVSISLSIYERYPIDLFHPSWSAAYLCSLPSKILRLPEVPRLYARKYTFICSFVVLGDLVSR